MGIASRQLTWRAGARAKGCDAVLAIATPLPDDVVQICKVFTIKPPFGATAAIRAMCYWLRSLPVAPSWEILTPTTL